jgi:hypothetical protein
MTGVLSNSFHLNTPPTWPQPWAEIPGFRSFLVSLPDKEGIYINVHAKKTKHSILETYMKQFCLTLLQQQ